MRDGFYAGFAPQGKVGNCHFVQRGQKDFNRLHAARQREPQGSLERHFRVGSLRGEWRAIDKDFYIAIGARRFRLHGEIHFQCLCVGAHFQGDARVAARTDDHAVVALELLQLPRREAAQAYARGRVPGSQRAGSVGKKGLGRKLHNGLQI